MRWDSKEEATEAIMDIAEEFRDRLPLSKPMSFAWNNRLRTVAGQAGLAGDVPHFELNPKLVARATLDQLYELVGHEYCHLVNLERYPDTPSHGDTWAALMREVGLVPHVHHNIDMTGILRSKYSQKCASCNALVYIPKKFRQLMLRGFMPHCDRCFNPVGVI
jgi:predicted SprT family Zn-dependent metalloprotease